MKNMLGNIEEIFKDLEKTKDEMSKGLSKEDKVKFNESLKHFQNDFIKMNENTELAESVAKEIVNKMKL